MDDEAIYCMLLKATCELKDQIDELVDKNHDKIGIEEIVCVRDMIKKLLKQYLCYAKYDTKSKSISNYKFEEHTKNSTKNKTNELFEVTSKFCAELDMIKNYMKRKINNKNKCENENSVNDRQNDLHRKCNLQLKSYEEKVNELECRLRGFMHFMIKEQRLNERNKSLHTQRETCLKTTISKLKKTVCYNKDEVQRLTEKLDYVCRRSDEREKLTNEVVAKIEELKCIAKKNTTFFVELEKSLSSVVVDLSLSNRKSTASEMQNNRNEERSCRTPEVEEVAASDFLHPVLHSTPNRPRAGDCCCVKPCEWVEDYDEGGDQMISCICTTDEPEVSENNVDCPKRQTSKTSRTTSKNVDNCQTTDGMSTPGKKRETTDSCDTVSLTYCSYCDQRNSLTRNIQF